MARAKKRRARSKPGRAKLTTLIVGEEDPPITTLVYGEENPPITTLAYGEEHVLTTLAIGEECHPTLPISEETPRPQTVGAATGKGGHISTLALGEETVFTTLAIGEEHPITQIAGEK